MSVMTKAELELRDAEIQKAINELGTRLLNESRDGIAYFVESKIIEQRLNAGDYAEEADPNETEV